MRKFFLMSSCSVLLYAWVTLSAALVTTRHAHTSTSTKRVSLLLASLGNASRQPQPTSIQTALMAVSLNGEALIDTESPRLKRARLRIAEAQGLLPIGTSEQMRGLRDDEAADILLSSKQDKGSAVKSKVREIGWRLAEPLVKYDPDMAAKRLFSQPFRWLGRNIEIFVPLAIFTLQVLGDIVSGEEETRRQERAESLLDIISAQSPALIKAGQALASRSDLLPKEYLDTLQKLQDRCPSYPTDQALLLFREEFGVDFEEIFVLDTTVQQPVAAASIGQVYKAILRKNGASVAVKIQRPNCEDAIAVDLFVLRWYAGKVQWLLKLVFQRDVDMVSVIDDFGDLIYREIDYRSEAVNAQRFAELYAR